jgi:hypothetical protein
LIHQNFQLHRLDDFGVECGVCTTASPPLEKFNMDSRNASSPMNAPLILFNSNIRTVPGNFGETVDRQNEIRQVTILTTSHKISSLTRLRLKGDLET